VTYTVLGVALITAALVGLWAFNAGRRFEREQIEQRMRAYQRKLRQMERR
jgi:hypothetical protein